MRLLVLVLVACSGPRAPEPIENRASARSAVQCVKARGTVRDRVTKEALPGVTIVISGVAGAGEDVTITDENGAFELAVTADRTLITVYYAEVTHRLPFTACDGNLIELALTNTTRGNSNLP
jgi:hypothetical protein